MKPQNLDDVLLDAIHNGAGPIPQASRLAYYNRIGAWLDGCSLPTPRALADAIRQVQSELLRPVKSGAA